MRAGRRLGPSLFPGLRCLLESVSRATPALLRAMKLFNDAFHTHMPFVFENSLLYCRAAERPVAPGMAHGPDAVYRPYDIYCSDLDGKNSFYIGAGLGEHVIACSPNAYRDLEGRIVLNYVAVEMFAGDLGYQHYRRQGLNLRDLAERERVPGLYGTAVNCQAENRLFAYFVLRWTDRSYLVQHCKTTRKRRKWTLENTGMLERAVCVDDHSVILTHRGLSAEPKSLLLDTKDHELRAIKVNGRDVYKCHLSNGELYYAVRSTGPGYHMALHRDAYALEASNVLITATEWF